MGLEEAAEAFRSRAGIAQQHIDNLEPEVVAAEEVPEIDEDTILDLGDPVKEDGDGEAETAESTDVEPDGEAADTGE